IGLLESGLLLAGELPAGLEALHEVWWGQLDAAGPPPAAGLAPAGPPAAPILLAPPPRTHPLAARRPLLRWRALIELDERARLYHASTRDFIAVRAGDELAGAHAAYVALARARAGNQFESLNPISEGYLVRQLARHAALSERATRTTVIP